MAETVVEVFANRLASHIRTCERDAAALRSAQAGERVDQLGLTVPVHAGDAHDLTCPDLERDVSHLLETAIVTDGKPFDLEERFPDGVGRLVHPEQNLTARP